MKYFRFFLVLVAATVAMESSALAQVKDKTFDDWTVYTTTLQDKKACYIAGFPKGKSGSYKRRDEPYFLVTRISETVDEVSASSGYKYKADSDVSVEIQNSKFKMFTKGELSWAPDGQKDADMVDAMKKGSNMTVRGTSAKGSYSVDKYSLKGFSSAYKRMHEVCDAAGN